MSFGVTESAVNLSLAPIDKKGVVVHEIHTFGPYPLPASSEAPSPFYLTPSSNVSRDVSAMNGRDSKGSWPKKAQISVGGSTPVVSFKIASQRPDGKHFKMSKNAVVTFGKLEAGKNSITYI